MKIKMRNVRNSSKGHSWLFEDELKKDAWGNLYIKKEVIEEYLGHSIKKEELESAEMEINIQDFTSTSAGWTKILNVQKINFRDDFISKEQNLPMIEKESENLIKPTKKIVEIKPNFEEMIDEPINEEMIDMSINVNKSEKPVFDFVDIYSTITDEGTTSHSFAKNKQMQNLLNKTLENNARSLFVNAVKSRMLDYDEYRFFDNGKIEEFLYDDSRLHLTLEQPKQLQENKKETLEKLAEEYSMFYTKKNFELYSKNKISWKEMASSINNKMISKFRSIKKIARSAEEYKKETGNWTFYLSWPFVEGRTKTKAIRTPLMYRPVSIEIKPGKYILKKMEEKIRINTELIKSIYAEQQQAPAELNIYFDSIQEIFKEYAKHGIQFKNQLDEIGSLKKINKEDYKKTLGSQVEVFTLKNYALFENILKSDDIYNDMMRIYRDFQDINKPSRTNNLFDEEVEFKQVKMPFDIDENKKRVVDSALKDSTTIFGPPGTGKSEVITTILVKIISEGKKALVVSEKDVALSVLIERLFEKYNMDVFALKLNGNSLSKTIFWEKVRKVIEVITKSPEIKKPKEPNNYLEFLKKMHKFLKEVNLDGNPDAEYEFHENARILNNLYKTFDINEDIATWIRGIKKALKEHEEYVAKLTKLHEEVEIYQDKIEESKMELKGKKDKMESFLVTPLCFISKKNIDLSLMYSMKDNNKDLFKYLNNKFSGTFSRRKAFKNNIKSLLEFIDAMNDYVDFKEKKSVEKNEERISKIHEEINLNENKKISLEKGIFENKKILFIKENTNFNEQMIKKFSRVEEIYKNFYKKEFDDTQKMHDKFKKRMNLVFNEAKAYFHSIAINEIQRKIRESDEIKDNIQTLKTMSGYSTRKQRKPTLIVKNYFKSISILFPIIISTPNEVSKYLPNDTNIFEYGIFDEASQMLLERALPSIHRSEKVIIAGDEKQLGPNLFFTRKYEEEIEYDFTAEATELDADSLLSWGKSRFKQELLNVHYRSSNAKLIEYSNINFYNGKLKAANSPVAEAYPIILEQVKGIWENNINTQEASLIIDKVKEIVENNQFNKIGVITMNAPQANHIKNLMEEDPILFKILYGNSSKKTIFVKNVENVQGDEADIVIFSLSYSANEKDSMNLGGLTHITKERINVAITRAKHKMIVYKSFMSSELGVGTEDKGRNILYKWVRWLEENASNPEDMERHPVLKHENIFRSPFEEEFYELIVQNLNERFVVKANYHINGYELDLVIFDVQEQKFFAAIELDGKTYHSRPEQIMHDIEKTDYLESIGWNIIRVPSTSFWKDKVKCVETTVKRLFA